MIVLFLLLISQIKSAPTNNSPDDLYKDAKKSFDEGNFELANKKFERFLLTYPPACSVGSVGTQRAVSLLTPSVLYWAGKLKENPVKALEYYKKVINNYPDNEYAPYALYNIAQYEYIKGNYTSAIELCQKLATTYPEFRIQDSEFRIRDLYFIQIGAFSDSARAIKAQKEFMGRKGQLPLPLIIVKTQGFFKLKIVPPKRDYESAQQFMLENNLQGFITK